MIIRLIYYNGLLDSIHSGKEVVMNICIITVYNSENCGSYIQAYSLMKILEYMGHDVIFLERKMTGKNYGPIRHIRESLKKLLKGNIWSAKAEWMRYFAFSLARKKFKIYNERSATFQKTELIVIGSDTIWNFDSDFFYKKRDVFLGTKFRNKKIIAYAASIANTSYDTILKDDELLNGIKDINKVSVRDEYTKKLVDLIRNDSIAVVVDPTMLLKEKNFLELEMKVDSNNYILIYYFGKITDKKKENILKLKAQTGKQIISFGEHISWADKNVVYDPFAFLGYFHNADFIITNTFHGTIFSVLYEKKFADYGADKQKVKNLLEQLELQCCICDETTELSSLMNTEIDYDRVNEKIDMLRQTSLQYLKTAIEGESK